jgi:hypothetical protein
MTLAASSAGVVLPFFLIALVREKMVKIVPSNTGTSHLVKADQIPKVTATAFPPENFRKGEKDRKSVV